MSEDVERLNDGKTRRDFLTLSAGAFAVIGSAAVSWPLIDQMNPDAATQSLATVEVDLSSIAEGQGVTVMWRGKPVFIRHRTEKEIEEADDIHYLNLRDRYARNANLPDDAPATDVNRTHPEHRNWLILIGVCKHFGCVPKGHRTGEVKGRFGGWKCPCHFSLYDSSGRVRWGAAPMNLAVPPYIFVDENIVRIG